MKKRQLLKTLLLLSQIVFVPIFAQPKLESGVVITGEVYDSNGPLMQVMVTENDENDSIVASTTTDVNGYFSFLLVNPRDRLYLSYAGYDTVEIPFARTHFSIKMIPSSPYLLRKADVKRFGSIKKDSNTMNYLLSYAPKDYVCGYVMASPYGSIIYGLFLVRDNNKYDLVCKKADTIEVRHIEPNLVKKLESSINSKVMFDDTPIVDNINIVDNGVFPRAEILYEGFTTFSLTSDKVSYYLVGMSKVIPDSIWQEELLKFNVK